MGIIFAISTLNCIWNEKCPHTRVQVEFFQDETNEIFSKGTKNSWNLKQKSSGPYFESYSTRSCLFTGQSIKHKCHFGLHFWQIFLKCTSLFDDGSICRRGKVHFSKYSHEDLTKACIKIRGCLTIFFRMFQTLMNDNVWGTKVFCFYQPFCRPLQTREPPWLRFNGFPQGIWIRSSVGGKFFNWNQCEWLPFYQLFNFEPYHLA